MNRRVIRYIVLLGAVSVIGIILIQVYWFREAYHLKEKQFNQSVTIALKNVAQIIARYNEAQLSYENPVIQESPGYFIVNVNSHIDLEILEYYLIKEFEYHNINLDFEYGVYDCTTDSMIYGACLNVMLDTCSRERVAAFPKTDKFTYYFAVHFPARSIFRFGNMNIWYFFTFILFLVILTFAFAIFIILKQRRLSEIQKDFINNMTHEFKTPISSISISADVLSKPDIAESPDKLKNYAGIIKVQNKRLQNHVENILKMASLESNRIKLNKQDVDLHSVIAEVEENAALNFSQIEYSIETDLQAKSSFVHADRFHLTNIIYNLVDNAIKYNDKNPEILISTVDLPVGIELIIKDNGIGISKKYRKKVFDRFYRVPTGNIHDVKGFGLGLNYVKNIVKSHGWKINLESEEGRGSVFSIIMQ